ncbi:MAG: RNA-guided pseudouridylation complex pseudouridine synthase subunit Cbf5 [Candidatus Pacearchaeota archaeon]|jgi:H/ACA ribonucleoprotein complex subunit 4
MDLQKIKSSKSISELLEFGIINIDKPSGPTSFDISDRIRKMLNLRKTSHFGTLDPKVTGVLPIALNRACKLTGYFLGEDKEYVGILRLHEEVSIEKLKKIIKEKFLGEITQKPPVKSRVKRQERQRTIYSFDILEQSSENQKDFLFKAKVQGGTYIRKLIDDLGKNLGIGAHMLELRRVSAGIFFENDKKYPSVNMYDFEKAVEEYEKGNENFLREIIVPAEIVSEIYFLVEIKSEDLKSILTGKPIKYSDLEKKQNLEKGKIISVFCKEKFIGMYKITNESEVFARSEFVMQPLKG